MSAIQGIYSINVSNRFDLGAGEDNESDGDELIDPVEQLKQLEERRERERALKKQEKAQQAKKASKKGVQFKENKDANLTTKKEPVEKDTKNVAPKQGGRGPRRGGYQGNDRQYGEGDENRRPPRRRNDGNFPSEKRGGGDRYSEPRDQFPPAVKSDQAGVDGDNKNRKTERQDRFRNGRGNYRGNGGPRNFRSNYRSDGRDDRGKREFDRRSGSDRTGVRATDKRDGGGPRNWGTPGNVDDETTATLNTEEVVNWADQVETEEQNENAKKSDKEDEEKKEEGEKSDGEAAQQETELTLDEWKAMQKQEKAEFNIRKPGEGEDNAKWKGMKMLHASSAKEGAGGRNAPEDGHRKNVKLLVDMDIRFTDPSRGMKGGRGRGGNRGGRFSGGRGRGNPGGDRYGSRSGQRPPDVLNESEFPTLPAA